MSAAAFKIGSTDVGEHFPTYFIADIAANHDGNLEQAIRLIQLAADAGADAAKFQNFQAPKIVSDYGFKHLGSVASHQSTWKKSVFEVYEQASLDWDWTPLLRDECQKCGIHYLSTPYDFEAVKMLSPFVPAFKIGSGDITWLEILELVAQQGKPVLLATGASSLSEVRGAMDIIQKHNQQICLMQCNTNYTGNLENFRHINLRALKLFAREFPQVVLGLSDHTPGHATVLGAVSLGARVIEKHFTDDPLKEGPDHHFSMTPKSWREMVDRVRELELALGEETKSVMPNEQETVIIQRRCVRAKVDLPTGTIISRQQLEVLRPAEPGAIMPQDIARLEGRKLLVSINKGQALRWENVKE